MSTILQFEASSFSAISSAVEAGKVSKPEAARCSRSAAFRLSGGPTMMIPFFFMPFDISSRLMSMVEHAHVLHGNNRPVRIRARCQVDDKQGLRFGVDAEGAMVGGIKRD